MNAGEMIICGILICQIPSLVGMVKVVSYKDGTKLILQCATNFTDLTMEFKPVSSNKTTRIAECIYAVDDCYLMDQTLKGVYEIKLTDSGGQLTILNVTNEVRGTYNCFETYFHNYVKVVILADSIAAYTGVTVAVTCGVVVGACAVVCTIVIFVHMRQNRRKRYKTPEERESASGCYAHSAIGL